MKMRKVIIILLVVILSGCSTGEVDSGVFEYKGSNVGDNSSVGKIIHHLEEKEQIEGFELSTNEEPYGITVNYNGLEDEETAVYYATYLFTLITNADWVSIHFNDAEITITKDDLQGWYGEDLEKIDSEEELLDLIENHTKNLDDLTK